MTKNKTNEVVFFQASATVGVQFMKMMGDYVKLQDTDDFDVQIDLMNLYDDLLSLYHEYQYND